jgi:hypothetical protein
VVPALFPNANVAVRWKGSNDTTTSFSEMVGYWWVFSLLSVRAPATSTGEGGKADFVTVGRRGGFFTHTAAVVDDRHGFWTFFLSSLLFIVINYCILLGALWLSLSRSHRERERERRESMAFAVGKINIFLMGSRKRKNSMTGKIGMFFFFFLLLLGLIHFQPHGIMMTMMPFARGWLYCFVCVNAHDARRIPRPAGKTE